MPLATPLVEPGVPDISDLKKLIDHVINGNVDGIFILGTTGETTDLSYERQCQIVEETCKYARGRTRIFVGIINMPLEKALELTRFAAENKADGMVLAAPNYPINQDEILEYAQVFLQRCPLPVCLYNRPGQQDIVFKIDIIKQLFEYNNLIGIKDSSADMDNFRELIKLKQLRKNWSVSMGYEWLVAKAIPMGADGGISGGANLFPELYVKLYQAAVQKNELEVRRLQGQVETFVGQVYQPDYIMGLKYALSRKGLCNEILSDPSQVISREQKEKIDQYLESIDETSFLFFYNI